MDDPPPSDGSEPEPGSDCAEGARAAASVVAAADGEPLAAEPKLTGEPLAAEPAQERGLLADAASSLDAVLPKDPLAAEIEALRQQQQALRYQKLCLQKDLCSARRKKARLSEKARQLSDKDLVSVLMMRKELRDSRAARAPRAGEAADTRPEPSSSDGAGSDSVRVCAGDERPST